MCIVFFFVVQVRTATPPGLYEQCKQETKALELSQVHFSADGKEIVVEVYSNVCIAHFGLFIFEHVKTINWFFVCDFNRCHGRCCRCQTFLPMWKSSQRFVKPFLLIVCFFFFVVFTFFIIIVHQSLHLQTANLTILRQGINFLSFQDSTAVCFTCTHKQRWKMEER